MRNQPTWLRVREDRVIEQKRSIQSRLDTAHKSVVRGLTDKPHRDPYVMNQIGENDMVRIEALYWNRLWADHPFYQVEVPDYPSDLLIEWRDRR